MTTATVNTTQLFTSLDETWDELEQLIASTNADSINAVPSKGCWSAAQQATHITKSNKAMAQAFMMEGKPAERDPKQGEPHLREMFLDFNAKYKSPDFIVPEEGNYKKESVINNLKDSINKLKQLRNSVSLIDIISIPALGEVTKLELLYFVLYHTQRHLHQLKNILKH